MDDPKSRGRKHLKNKQKYKPSKLNVTKTAVSANKSKESIISSKPSRQKVTGSNWDRYESDSEEDNKNVLTNSTNFSLLANATITQGSYFQFKTDKNIPFDIDYEETNSQIGADLFKIDLNVLSESIATIPFMQRSDISEHYFSDSQKKYMERNTLDNKNAYFNKYKNELIKPKITINNNTKDDYEEVLNLNQNNTDFINEIDDLLDDVKEINLTDNTKPEIDSKLSEPAKTVDNKSEHELEQWLDDILDS